MLFTYTTFFFVAARLAVNALALPVVEDNNAELQARAGAGLGTIARDHVEYTVNPSAALNAIPPAENNAMRETHRKAHETIFKVMTGGGGNAGNKAGNDAAEKGGKADKPAA